MVTATGAALRGKLVTAEPRAALPRRAVTATRAARRGKLLGWYG